MLANGLTAAPTLRRVLEAMEGAASPGAAEPDAEWYARFARAMRAAYAERLSGPRRRRAARRREAAPPTSPPATATA
jgi:hypothetical protein